MITIILLKKSYTYDTAWNGVASDNPSLPSARSIGLSEGEEPCA